MFPSRPAYGSVHLQSSAVLLACALGLAATAGTAAAAPDEELPLWELGAIVGVGYLPDYPASDEYGVQALPLPYVAYRGEVIRSDDKGLLRGRVFRSEDVELDVSLTGSIPVRSSDNRARAGMPDIDWLGEAGPRLQVTVARGARDAKIDFELPLRAVLSTDFSRVDYEGIVLLPELAYQTDSILGSRSRLKVGIGIRFADRRFQELMYGVPAAYATASRPAYEAKSGYMGSRLLIQFSKPLNGRLRLIGAARLDYHGGAANKASPLFRRETTGSVALALIWSIVQSAATAIE